MDYVTNWCWCSSSNWDGGQYNCKHMVSLENFTPECEDDWENLVDEDAERYEDDEYYEAFGRPMMKKAPNWKPHVLKWLEENVPDYDPVKDRTEEKKGWCIGSTQYRARAGVSGISVFFQRRKDAMNFIKEFSVHKKPVYYCHYFNGVRKRLDLDTMKYVPIK